MNYNIDSYITDLNRNYKNHAQAGNDFLAACYKQAADRKLQLKKQLRLDTDTETEITADTRTLRNGRTRTVTATREFRTNEEIYDGFLLFDTEEVEEQWEETFGESRCPEDFREEWYDYCSEYN